MSTRHYNILVIDDEIQSRKSQYHTLAAGSPLKFTFVESAGELRSIAGKTMVDGYLIDVNLEKWGITSAEVIQKYISGSARKKPTFLLSAYLDSNNTTRAMQAIRESEAGTYADLFAWRDFADPATGEIRDSIELENVRQRMLRRLGDWYHRSEVAFSKDRSDIRILHLSDPQFGDPGLNGAMSFNEHLISEALTEHLGTAKRSDASLVDFVVISGDITYSGQVSEFHQAKVWLENALLPALWPLKSLEDAKERLIITPGNHDANLRALACEGLQYNFGWRKDNTKPLMIPTNRIEPEYRNHLFQNYIDFLRSMDLEAAKQIKTGSSLTWTVDRFSHAGIQFLLVNTACGITCEDPDKAWIEEDSLRSILDPNPEAEPSVSLVRICVGHHPITLKRPSDKVIENGQALLPVFRAKRIIAYLHGHSHDYGADTLIPNKVLAAMSPTSNVSVTDGRQGFNLVTVKRKENKGVLAASALLVETCEFHKNGTFQWLSNKTEMKISKHG